jgi:transposase
MAKNPKIDLWFEDECHFQQHGTRCAMWIPPEETDPVVLLAPTRKSVSVFGAVRVEDGRLVTQKDKVFDSETFLIFLKRLLLSRRPGRKIVIFLDNARWHHAKLLQPWLRKHRRTIRLDFLPPYSPELNAIERVWKITRRLCTHNQYFAELEDLVDVVFNQFKHWNRPNNVLRRLCAIT